MEVGAVVHVFVRDVADHQKCAECAKKLYDYQYYNIFYSDITIRTSNISDLYAR